MTTRSWIDVLRQKQCWLPGCNPFLRPVGKRIVREEVYIEPPKKIEESINFVTEAWADLAADKSFAGMTLEQFKVRVKPSLDARNELATARNTRINALTGRMVSDDESQKTLLLVVNAIKGDPTEGEDSALYEACGYVPKSKRKSGLSRKAKTAVAQVSAS